MTSPYHYQRRIEGLSRTCRLCGEDWPLTVDFWQVVRHRLDGTPILRATCRACRSRRNPLSRVGGSILGPCPCQGCGALLHWTVGGWNEVHDSGRRRILRFHQCRVAVAA